MGTRSRQLAFRSIIAFAAALGLGRVLFTALSPNQMPEPTPVVSQSVPATLVSTSTAAAPAVNTTTDPLRPTIDRTFKIVDGGVLNDNARLSHFLPTNYAEGTLHKAPYQFAASARFRPASAVLTRGETTVAVLGQTPNSRAKLQSDNVVIYPATYPDTDERMHIRPDGGIEHDYILTQRPAGMDDGHNLVYSGYLQLSPGLTMWDGKKQITSKHVTRNGINLKNSFGNTVLYLRRPVAWDAVVTNEDGTLNKSKQSEEAFINCAVTCEYHIDFDQSGIKLSVVTPGSWLASSTRVFPVTIDPNFGPFGLADGDPPIYTGTAGADTIIPANAGGTPLVIVDNCPAKPDNGYGIIPMPFPFEYYGTVHNAGAPLFVHIDGFASWTPPRPFPLTPNPCMDTDNFAIPTGGYPDDAFFAYWDDLRFSTTQGSGIYWFVDGAAPSRRLVIMWYKMGYSRGTNTEVISFNLVLYECENKAQFIIGLPNETDAGLASVGIENQTGALGIQYDFNSAFGGAGQGTQFTGVNPVFQNNNNNNNNNGGFIGAGGLGAGQNTTGGVPNTGSNTQPIVPGTSVAFQRSALGFLSVTTTPRAGCKPLTVCYDSTITIPASTCATNATPISFGYNWIFGDNSQAFTQDVCHTYTIPNVYNTILEITDEFGTKTSLEFDVRVCDRPDVVIIATPQGGYAPLVVDLEARAMAPTFQNVDTPTAPSPLWQVDLLGPNNEPGQSTLLGTASGSPVQARFDLPGLYRVQVLFSGTDTVTSLPSTGVGVVYIYVASTTDVIEDALVITESKLTIDWLGKRDGSDPDGLPPNNGSAVPGLGFPDNPENDTVFIKGFISLPGVRESDLLGRRARVILNGTDAIFDGVLDATGKGVFTDTLTGRAGFFDINLPEGTFYCSVRRSLYVTLGVGDTTERRLLPAFYRIEVENLFPPVGFSGALITYDYSSKGTPPVTVSNTAPSTGGARGSYKFGSFTNNGVISGAPEDFGRPGGQTLLVTGAFMVTKAKFKAEGDMVTVDLQGKLARFGGDDLRPAENSDVKISLGNYSETLNFNGTQGFKTTGKPPSQRFTYKRPKTLAKNGIASFTWANRAGDFRLKTYPIPNAAGDVNKLGLDKALALQILQMGLVITPDNNNTYNGAARFDVYRKSPVDFVHGVRK